MYSFFENIGVVSYTVSAVFFLFFALLMLTGRQGQRQKLVLSLACFVSAIWSAVSAVFASHAFDSSGLEVGVYILEMLRNDSWLAFLIVLVWFGYEGSEFNRSKKISIAALILLNLILIVSITVDFSAFLDVGLLVSNNVVIYANLIFSLIGMVLVEQLYRNAKPEVRVGFKYLCIGLGSMFVYDFYIYSHALLLQRVDVALWEARGFINAMVIPVLGIAVMRNKDWSKEIFVSRRIVFHTTGLLGAGVYLLAMGAGGYYVKLYGGSWGGVAQVIFLFAAALILIILLFSGQLRARGRVWINKHFFHYKYDYREEWLRFIRTLSFGDPDSQLRERAIMAIAQIIDSAGGVLWLINESNQFTPVADWHMEVPNNADENEDSPLMVFLEGLEWVINLDEYEITPEIYMGLKLPDWISQMPDAWLIVPLVLHEQLFGFVVLAKAPVRKHFNWEDCDLLKTAGRQAASHLSQLESSRALAETQQFEAYHRLSAYIVHDLKNLAAQWSLLISNVAKHKSNPAFIEDMVGTVDNSVQKMNRILAQLRSGASQGQNVSNVDLVKLLQEVIEDKSSSKPIPSLKTTVTANSIIRADRERLSTVLGNLIQNAKDACERDDDVTVYLEIIDSKIEIKIQDSGSGMDKIFIRDNLFRPFYTTKGVAGMGIGAYEAREFIQSLGGSIVVDSHLGDGTTFSIYLPVAQ